MHLVWSRPEVLNFFVVLPLVNIVGFNPIKTSGSYMSQQSYQFLTPYFVCAGSV
jgi:hypothetical protein